MKKLLIALLMAVSPLSYSSDLPDNGVFQEVCDCFPFSIIGMQDSKIQSVNRSLNNGAALQYVLYDNNVRNAQINQGSLVKSMDRYVSDFSRYFKYHPQLKGRLVVKINYYPGYQKPFQYAVPSNSENYINNVNKDIAKASTCNEYDFCSALFIDHIKFTGNNEAKFDQVKFMKVINDNNTPHTNVFFKNHHYTEVVSFYLIMSTNGYYISKEEVLGVQNSINNKAP